MAPGDTLELAPISDVPRSTAPGGLYVHVPFCRRVCPYCDFAVLVDQPALHDRYIDAVGSEIAAVARESGGVTFDTIYLGGGTPSALSPQHLQRLIGAVRQAFDGASSAALHMEANPEDVDSKSAQAWLDFGVEFVSLGVQSLDAKALKQLGRRHTPFEAQRAVQVLREVGVPTVGVDAMFGRPGQSTEEWRLELERLAALEVDHLSVYQLTIHPETPFARAVDKDVFTELDEDSKHDHFVLTHETLIKAGFDAYEVSNFARSTAHRSRHNPKYWDHRTYVGLGPSAHSHREGVRHWNTRNLGEYLGLIEDGRSPLAGHETLSESNLALEVLMLRLRTIDGIDLQDFEVRFGVDLRVARSSWIERARALDQLESDPNRLRLRPAGLAIADAAARELSPLQHELRSR